MEFGILADAILGTQRIIPEMIQASPDTISGIGAEYMKGIAADGTIILDAGKILGDTRIMVHEEIG
jgi:purine-binding chemotaxis protein CheW